MSDTVTLFAAGAALRVHRRGAEALSWTVGGRELLWQGGEAWPRTAPILFPIVGRARDGAIRIDGRTYPIGIHGFAPDSDFTVAEAGPDGVAFTLAADAATRRRYPFAFRLEVAYRLEPDAVRVTMRVANDGDVAMPFAIGTHPGFAWPFAGGGAGGHRIVFDRDVAPFVPVISPRGLFTDGRRAVPVERRVLELSPALLAREALCFLDAGCASVRFVAPGGAAIVVETANFPHLALWSRPPAPFLCIESWTGHGDPDEFDGALHDKPSMLVLGPGAVSEHAVRWRFEEGA